MRKICQTDRYFYAVKVPLKLWIGYVNVFGGGYLYYHNHQYQYDYCYYHQNHYSH